MLLGNTHSAPLPVLTDLVQHWRDDANEDIDRSYVGCHRVFDDALRRSQIVASPGLMELMLHIPDRFPPFEVRFCEFEYLGPACRADSVRNGKVLIVRAFTKKLLALATPPQHDGSTA
jgi:hypothetical protein